MARFNLDDYIDVAERIEQFYEKYPNGRITTELVNFSTWEGKQTQFIVRAFLWANEEGFHPLATGLAEESFGPSGPNQTSPCEVSETSAIGRAIANLGFQTTREGKRQRPSRQEMEKVERGTEKPSDALARALMSAFTGKEERKEFVEKVVGHPVDKLENLTTEEMAEVMLELP